MKIINKFKQLSRDIKLIIITALIVSCIGVYAAGTCIISASAGDVTYNNSTVQTAIDELYTLARNHCPEGYECKEKKYVTDCDNEKVYSTTPSNLKGLAKVMAKDAYLDNGNSEYVSSCNGVDFNVVSSDTNGKGIYEIASTKNDTYPIYYYRGEVDNNNVKFAGFCWKAVRTTDTGGVKMIYNGVPDSDGYCENLPDYDYINSGIYNTSNSSLADGGFMYGTRYSNYLNIKTVYAHSLAAKTYLFGSGVTYSNGTYTLTNPSTISDWSTAYSNYLGYYTCSSTSSSCSTVHYIIKTSSNYYYYFILSNGIKGTDELKFGNDVTYSNGTYTLVDTITIKPNEWTVKYDELNNNHYTCFSTGNTCTSVKYIYHTGSTVMEYTTLTNGKKVEDALDEMFVNTTSSTAKTTVENWYNMNLSSYSSYIEDTVYCNDRSITQSGGWNPDGGNLLSPFYFDTVVRLSTGLPNLVCSRPEDRFTVSSSKGNGALTYPIGLITSDEVMYAGAGNGQNRNCYLNNNSSQIWTMSPSSTASVLMMNEAGELIDNAVGGSYYYRPVISIAPNVDINSGDGTSTNPYVISTS